jgi:hypothetical protein
MRCATCGEEHPLEELEPAFARPDPYVAIPREARERIARANDDFCRIDGPPERWFVRAVLPVRVAGREVPLRWGLWAEVSEAAFARIVERWRDPEQAREAPFDAALANEIPGLRTLGLPCRLQLSGLTTRPFLSFAPDLDHPFAREQRAGVSEARALEWLHAIRRPEAGA